MTERTPERNRRLHRKFWLLLFALLTAVGIYHSRKPLPEGINFRGASHLIPAADVVFLKDLTYRGPEGRKVHEQEIFDALFAAIDRAEETVLLDMFLFNSYGSGSIVPLRPLAAELASRLVARKERRPTIGIDFITDPINVVYGGAPSARITALRAAGINVIMTDLSRLRDSNPIYSAFWRSFIEWFGNDDGGGPAPHPFSKGAPTVTLRSYFSMLNFRANHRKVFLSESGGRVTSIISSANPHDGSSAHSNVALQVTGAIGRDIFFTEGAVARFSGGKIGRAPASRGITADPGGGMAAVVLLTENRIEEAILDTIGECGQGDDLWLAMFYLADRHVVEALLEAAERGARIRLVLDPNRDAFGYEKNGIPNRPVAHELVDKSGGAIAIRWYDTQGEQYHSKMVYAERADGSATVILGSANLTRRNLDSYNLELDVMVSARADIPPMKDIRDYFERVWNNRGGLYTVAYETYADDSTIRAMIYRFQEFTGLCSF